MLKLILLCLSCDVPCWGYIWTSSGRALPSAPLLNAGCEERPVDGFLSCWGHNFDRVFRRRQDHLAELHSAGDWLVTESESTCTVRCLGMVHGQMVSRTGTKGEKDCRHWKWARSQADSALFVLSDIHLRIYGIYGIYVPYLVCLAAKVWWGSHRWCLAQQGLEPNAVTGWWFQHVSNLYMGVSINGGTPKWMVYDAKTHQNWWFGVPPCIEPPICNNM